MFQGDPVADVDSDGRMHEEGCVWSVSKLAVGVRGWTKVSLDVRRWRDSEKRGSHCGRTRTD